MDAVPPLYDHVSHKLDVEDVEARLERLHSTLAKLNANGSSDTNPKNANPKTHPSNSPDFSFLYKGQAASRPCFVPPPTELLSRVQAFLPAFEASNACLEPGSADIVSEDGEGMYVEMNLGLGVFSTAPDPSVHEFPSYIPVHTLPNRSPFASSSSSASASSSASSSATSSPSLSFSSSTSSSYDDDESDSDSDSDAEIINTAFKPIRPVRSLPRRARMQQEKKQEKPRIVVLRDDERDMGEADASGG